MTATLINNPLDNKSSIDEQLWNRLVARIQKDHEFQAFFGDEPKELQHQIAESTIDQTVAFLVLVASSNGSASYSPSEKVDIGWHTFLMYTREYAEFCQEIAGRMIHHAPSDVPGVDYGTGNASRTAQAIMDRGMFVDADLWVSMANCSSGGPDYCTGDSCSGSTCNGE